MEKHKNAHLEGELVKLRKSAVEIVSATEAQHQQCSTRSTYPVCHRKLVLFLFLVRMPPETWVLWYGDF